MRRLAVFPRRLQGRQGLGLARGHHPRRPRWTGSGVRSDGRSRPRHRVGARPVLRLWAPNLRRTRSSPPATSGRLSRLGVGATKPDDAIDEGFAVPRRLYYGGVLMLGLLTLRLGGQVTFSDLLFLVSFLLACAEFVILRRRVPMKLPFLLLIGVALFSLGGLLSTFESYQTLKSIAVIARLVFLTVFWFWLGTVVLRRQAHVTRAIGFWVASAAICGGGAILQLLAGDVIPNTSFEGGRATGFTSHPNDLGGLTAIAFVPALMLASRPRAVRRYASLVICAAAPRRGRPDSVRVCRRPYRRRRGSRRLAGAPANVGSCPARPRHARRVRCRPGNASVAPWSARSTRPPRVGHELDLSARRRHEPRIRRAALRHVPGGDREDRGRPLRRRGPRSEERHSAVRGRGLRVRRPQSRHRPLVQDRAPGARRNSDRVASRFCDLDGLRFSGRAPPANRGLPLPS